MKMKPAELNNR